MMTAMSNASNSPSPPAAITYSCADMECNQFRPNKRKSHTATVVIFILQVLQIVDTYTHCVVPFVTVVTANLNANKKSQAVKVDMIRALHKMECNTAACRGCPTANSTERFHPYSNFHSL